MDRMRQVMFLRDMVVKVSSEDPECRVLLEEIVECAQIYFLAKQRQRGCDGFGEVTNLRDEMSDGLEKLLVLCAKRGQLPLPDKYDSESLARELMDFAGS